MVDAPAPATPQLEIKYLLPSEKFDEHGQILASHPHVDDFGPNELNDFVQVFQILQIGEKLIDSNSFDLIKHFLLNEVNEFIAVSLPAANMLRDCLKTSIEPFRNYEKKLISILEAEPGEEGGSESIAKLIDTVRSEMKNGICDKWVQLNQELLDKTARLKEKVQANSELADFRPSVILAESCFNRNIADILRYKVELNKTDLLANIAQAKQYYEAAIQLSKDEFPAEANLQYLSSVLNYCVFKYDCLGLHEEAFEELGKVHSIASKKLKEISGKVSPDYNEGIMFISHVCLFNLQSWRRANNNANDAADGGANEQDDMGDQSDSTLSSEKDDNE